MQQRREEKEASLGSLLTHAAIALQWSEAHEKSICIQSERTLTTLL